MAGLLSREKEFVKINEHLDKISDGNKKTNLDTLLSKLTSPKRTAGTTTSQRYNSTLPRTCSDSTGNSESTDYSIINNNCIHSTFPRSKLTPAMLKKRGAGDAEIDLMPVKLQTPRLKKCQAMSDAMPNSTGPMKIPAQPTSPKKTQNRHNRTTAYYSRQETGPKVTIPSIDTDNADVLCRSPSPSSARKNFLMHKNMKNIVSNNNNRRDHTNRNDNYFTIKYRNPKFIESPSLEMLIKDETNQIRDLSPHNENNNNQKTMEIINSRTNSRKQLTHDGLVKFLKSKITILEEDHARISEEMLEQKKLLELSIESNKKAEQQRDQLYSKNISLLDHLKKVEMQLDDVNRITKERMLDQSSKQKEIEANKREIKMMTQANANLEKRLAKAAEELENTRNILAAMKKSDKELKETVRVEKEAKDKQIKCLKKQRADLLNAYKKQLFLIDNLKKQNVCLEQSKLINAGAKEFNKVLEWTNNHPS